MTLNDYQHLATSTAIYPESVRLIYPTLGLTGEAGEVAEKVKKMFRDDGGELSETRRYDLARELGDVLWYISALSRDIGMTLEQVAQMNIDKLGKRAAQSTLTGDGDNR